VGVLILYRNGLIVITNIVSETDIQPLTGKEGTEFKPFMYREYYASRIRLTWGSVLDKGEEAQLDVDSRLKQYLADLDAANRS
jgi:hypothetical protein